MRKNSERFFRKLRAINEIMVSVQNLNRYGQKSMQIAFGDENFTC